MIKEAHRGDWVQVHAIVLPAGARAPQVPADTQAVPLEMWVKGFLLSSSASLGDTVEIKTVIGRTVTGRLVAVNPIYQHGFGEPVPELLTVGGECRVIVADAQAKGDGR